MMVHRSVFLTFNVAIKGLNISHAVYIYTLERPLTIDWTAEDTPYT